ncbi:hypothetical protein MSAN_02422200 [Mycena sanguinolenta]|uniref:Uncharacterized protein n=1 Tax=Mycena sanguinolenta TaxID=230812 RepID=A0A8H6X313_9AGAR|nr:hypothetical protein MSAN_02422200 [Mycena sanguinolenta]
MLSIVSIFLSVLLAGANPARATCSPSLLGTNISITNGPLEAGFSLNGPALVSQPISEGISEFAVGISDFGRRKWTLLKVADEELSLTNTGALPEMLPFEPPIVSPQSWIFECSSCVSEGSLIGEGCFVVSPSDGRCLNISNAAPAGSLVTLGDCDAIGGSINIYSAA